MYGPAARGQSTDGAGGLFPLALAFVRLGDHGAIRIPRAALLPPDSRIPAERGVPVEPAVPDPHQEMLRALASQEQAAFLRIGPRRNRWRDLLEYEERLVE
ncbi:MAG: hypothetical protein M3327_13645, partial [Actinomycetota bacterium]|nr:hypothetical protein [Actinomycetota bacterium]